MDAPTQNRSVCCARIDLSLVVSTLPKKETPHHAAPITGELADVPSNVWIPEAACVSA